MLKPLREKPKHYKILALDTEDDSKGGFIRACFVMENETLIFDSQPLAKQWLIEFSKTEKAKHYILLAHNLAYDLVNVLYPFDEDIELIMNASRLLSAKMNNLLMYDTFNHSFCSLAKIGEVFNYEKLAFDPNSREYVTRDTEIVYKYGLFLQEMYNQYSITFPLSLASGALKIWRRIFQRSTFRTLSMQLLDLIRKAYFGGRVEAYYIGNFKQDVYYYDVNSMYPFVMQGLFTDVDTLEYKKNPTKEYRGVVFAKIDVPNMEIPPLPLRLEDKRTIYPYGSYSGWYSTIELDYAESLGCNVKRLYGYVSSKSLHIFQEFIQHFYEKRMSATTSSQKLFYKLLMNSLYGKFGTGKEKRIIKPFTEKLNYDFVQEIFLSKYVLEVVDDEYPIYSNIWALEVTAYARVVLHRLMTNIRENGGTLLYCDTDSIIYHGGEKLPETKVLGGVKMEGESNCIEIVGAKEYVFKNTTKAKGVPKNKQDEYLHRGNTSYDKPIKLMEGLRRGLRPNVWTNVTKVKSTSYDRRIVLSNGFTQAWKVKDNVPCKDRKSSRGNKARAKR